MPLMRKPMIELDWPSWMTSRMPFEWNDMWSDLRSEVGVRVEEFEDKNQYVIRAEVPGIDPEKDVELTVTDSVLRLMVHRQQGSTSADAKHYRSEFHYGSFTMMIPLPASASDHDVKAQYKDGILEVRIPLNGSKAKEHRIQITR